MLPDFIIPGAMKSGSSSLVAYLKQHPNIFIPEGTGEIHFFSKEKNYKKGIEWYRNKFSNVLPNQIVGEKTPRYSESYVPSRMHKCLPDVKLIWILRNPVDRAYSHYNWYLWNGVETLSFEEALYKEEKRNNKNPTEFNMYNYKELSKYINHINNYLNYYDKSNMFFIIFEEFIQGPKKIANSLLDFLGVDMISNYKIPHKLKTKYIKNVNIQRIIRKITKTMIPNRYSKLVFNILSMFNSTSIKPKMTNSTRKNLINYFKPYNKKLEEFLDKDLSIWNT